MSTTLQRTLLALLVGVAAAGCSDRQPGLTVNAAAPAPDSGSTSFGGPGFFVPDVSSNPDPPDAGSSDDVGAPVDVPVSVPDVAADVIEPVDVVVSPCPLGSPCDDGSFCTTNDVCRDDGTCAGDPVVCDDGVPCTLDVCDGGVCSSKVAAGACHIDGTCYTEGQPSPGDACKLCLSNKAQKAWTDALGYDCDDGDACTEDDLCSPAGCTGTPLDCEDDNPCTKDACGEAGCVHAPIQGTCMVEEDDGDPCTGGVCDKGQCVTGPIEGPCDDGEPCTIGDTCQEGECVGGPLKDKDKDGYADQACGGTDCNDAVPAVHPDAALICNGKDNDCDGIIDNKEPDTGCCTYHTDCYPQKVCGLWPATGELRCSTPCGDSTECAAGEICSHMPGSANVGYCRPMSAPQGGVDGASCTDSSQCKSDGCADFLCVGMCQDQAHCAKIDHACHPAGESLVAGFNGVCSPYSAYPAGKPTGAGCSGNAGTCQSGHCDLWGSGQCTPLCTRDEECAIYQECNIVLRSEAAIQSSVPFDPAYTAKTYDAVLGCFARSYPNATGATGSLCSSPANCRSNKCLALLPAPSTDQWCTNFCVDDADCPADMKCKQEAMSVVSPFLNQLGKSLPGVRTFVRICKWK